MTTDLIHDLETAETGSRELSDSVLRALGWTIDGDDHITPDGSLRLHYSRAPIPSESVEDCLALVPEGCRLLVLREAPWRQWYATLCEREGMRMVESTDDDTGHATAALAFSAALVKASEVEK